MVLAGSAVPHWLDASASGRQTAWVMLGGAALLAAFIGSLAARTLIVAPARPSTTSTQRGLSCLWPILVANGLFGAGYVR